MCSISPSRNSLARSRRSRAQIKRTLRLLPAQSLGLRFPFQLRQTAQIDERHLQAMPRVGSPAPAGLPLPRSWYARIRGGEESRSSTSVAQACQAHLPIEAPWECCKWRYPAPTDPKTTAVAGQTTMAGSLDAEPAWSDGCCCPGALAFRKNSRIAGFCSRNCPSNSGVSV